MESVLHSTDISATGAFVLKLLATFAKKRRPDVALVNLGPNLHKGIPHEDFVIQRLFGSVVVSSERLVDEKKQRWITWKGLEFNLGLGDLAVDDVDDVSDYDEPIVDAVDDAPEKRHDVEREEEELSDGSQQGDLVVDATTIEAEEEFLTDVEIQEFGLKGGAVAPTEDKCARPQRSKVAMRRNGYIASSKVSKSAHQFLEGTKERDVRYTSIAVTKVSTLFGTQTWAGVYKEYARLRDTDVLGSIDPNMLKAEWGCVGFHDVHVVRYSFIKDLMDKGGVSITHCPAEKSFTTESTKPIRGALYYLFRDVMLRWKCLSMLNRTSVPSSPTSFEERVGDNTSEVDHECPKTRESTRTCLQRKTDGWTGSKLKSGTHVLVLNGKSCHSFETIPKERR